MKNINKKIMFVIIIAIACSTLIMPVYSAISEIPLNKNNNFEYTYSGMSAGKAEMIVSSWANNSSQGNQEIMPLNILCIFGHDIKNGVITQTYHNFSSTSPRCKEVISSVEYCGRDGCSYSKVLNETTCGLFCH